ncbi:hypothetical protein PVAND_014909 [Polypedilum vanderplanki]|uniref:Odorant receptor n=1 Tax=Polypedilum vanderplanki TaxID=319348 RepID=A0A9J6BBD2_POLVA|nr:hypothetical protein PVAND_014909 [Polypedilum vanderplanki]
MKRVENLTNLDNFFEIPFKWLNSIFFDFNTFDASKSLKEQRKLILKNITLWLIFLNTCIQVWILVDHLLGKPYELEKVSHGISSTFSITIVGIEILTLFVNKTNIMKTIKNLRNSYPTNDISVAAMSKKLEKFSIIQIIASIFMIILLALIPIVKTLITGEFSFLSPISNEFFFPKNVISFIFMTIWMTTMPIFVILFASTTFIVFAALVTTISLEFIILANEAKNFQNFNENEIKENFPIWIAKHNRAFENVEKINKIFSFPFLIRFIASGSIIAIQVFELQEAEYQKMSQIFLCATYTVFELSQTFMQCYFGQFLIDASENVAKEIYNCGWENWKDLKMKKLLIVVIERSQKAENLKIWKFGNISMEQFTMVLNTAYNYMSFLIAIHGEN